VLVLFVFCRFVKKIIENRLGKNFMKTIVEIKFGSHLYGTATAESDLDIKGIYIPSARDILLQRIKPVIVEKRTKTYREKNRPEDVDYELYSPEKYLSCLAKGQSFALEMLFAPDWAMMSEPHPKWYDIKKLASKLLTKQAASFVNYCKQQAYKYGLKGARLAAAKLALEALKKAELKYGTSVKLVTIIDILKKISQKDENLFVSDVSKENNQKELYFQICGKKALLNASIKNARLIAEKIVNEYGQRASEAEESKGADWKALSHAVRIGYQAIEFLKDHYMTFPRPEREHLLAIKQGKVDFQLVSQEIEDLLVKVQKEERRSTLPETYDQNLIDNFIEQLYLEQVLEVKKNNF